MVWFKRWKEDRRGNVKLDLNVGLESERYGVTANVGYDTKGENLRGGVGLELNSNLSINSTLTLVYIDYYFPKKKTERNRVLLLLF